MNKLRKVKLVHEGQYAAEVDVEVIEGDTPWAPYLSIEDAYKLDDVRDALRTGWLKGIRMNATDISRMGLSERLQAMEALWDSLLVDESEVESPAWHQDVLAKRKRKVEEGKAAFISLDELRARRKS